MGLFSKKGLEQLKKDFPLIKMEVGGIVTNVMLKSGMNYDNAASKSKAMYEAVAAELKAKLGYKLTSGEVSEFLNSPQFIEMGEGNELAEALADAILKLNK